MLVFFAEEVVTSRGVVSSVVFQTVNDVLLWVAEFVFYLADNQVVDLLLPI